MQLAKSAELIFPTGSTIRSDVFRENAYIARGERLEMAEAFRFMEAVYGSSVVAHAFSKALAHADRDAPAICTGFACTGQRHNHRNCNGRERRGSPERRHFSHQSRDRPDSLSEI